jgi:hypothetical protein
MRNKTSLPFVATALLSAALVGCSSNQQQVEQSADDTNQNRLLVRMALAENVYNGTATDRTVYPADFHYGSGDLNALGLRRVETLVHAYRGSTTHITVLRGDESDDVHDQRVQAVRQQFADAGFDKDNVVVATSDERNARSSSERAIVSFDRLMSDYRAKEGGKTGAPQPAGGTKSFSD